MKAIKSILAIFSFLFLSNSAFSSNYSCEDLINQIKTDINKFPEDAQQKNLPWHKFSYIQGMLGATSSKNQPTENTREYTWRCPSNSQAYLKVTTNHNNAIINIEGKYSGMSGAGFFSEDITPGDVEIISKPMANAAPMTVPGVPAITPTPQPTLPAGHAANTDEPKQHGYSHFAEDDRDTSMREARDNFQKWFHRNVSERHLVAAARKLTEAYYRKLRSCTPGHYQYPAQNPYYGQRTTDNKLQPMLTLQYATINGFHDGKCAVVFGRESAPEEGSCQFSKEALNSLAEIKLGISTTPGNMQSLKEYSNIMASSCAKATNNVASNTLN